MEKRLPREALWLQVALALCLFTSVHAGTLTDTGTATATTPSSTWIAFEAPFAGDEDRDGWTVVELGLDAGGPFDLVSPRRLPGAPEWRGDSFRGLTPDTDYYLRMTWVDPDGVSGTNPQIVGPVHTLATAPDALSVGIATAEVRETEIFVSVPISDDANANSYGTVEIATNFGGPWTRRCGDPSNNRLPHHPKRCRLRSLTPGTQYWVRIDLIDPDGTAGADPQVLGPLTFTGLENIAAGRPITADPGWGCCPNPAELVNHRIQNDDWFYGFAWTGGTGGWAGGPAGWKQATIDFGTATGFEGLAFWAHGTSNLPIDWKVESSDDGAFWSEVFSTTEPICRGASDATEVSWDYPSCPQEARFAEVTARYVRYSFDDRTLFSGLHGWGVELEVFSAPPPDLTAPSDPTAVESTSHDSGVWSALSQLNVQWSGASDEGSAGLAGYSVLFDTAAATLPDDSLEVVHATDPHTTMSNPLADGNSHYFHLRTCDNGGNCTATVHRGPYWIDATPPTAPGNLASTSHLTGTPSNNAILDIIWDSATDATSGTDGHAWSFDQGSDWSCDQVKDAEEGTTTAASDPLGDGSWYAHLCAVDHAGNWSTESHAGPYVIDVTAPGDPSSVASTSHVLSSWSNDSTIAVQWSGATDASGVSGYSFAFDTSPATLPDTTIDIAHGSDPHTFTSAGLADGQDHYFHMRTCDNVGNCTSSIHFGPFWIDATPPGVPPDLVSTSHTVGTPSNDRTIDIEWGSADDSESGIDGSSYVLSETAVWECDEVKELEESMTTATSASLNTRLWYGHLCAVDNAGNWSPVSTAGPFTIEVEELVFSDGFE